MSVIRPRFLIGSALLVLGISFGIWWCLPTRMPDTKEEVRTENAKLSSAQPDGGISPLLSRRRLSTANRSPTAIANGSSGDGGTPQQPKSSALPHSLEEALRVYPQAEENILRYIRYTHQKS